MNTMINGFINFTDLVEKLLGRDIATQAELDHTEKVFKVWRTQFNYISPRFAGEVVTVLEGAK